MIQTGRAQTSYVVARPPPSPSFKSGDKEADLLLASNVNEATILRSPPRADE
jgi:hypothetical protein